MDRGGKAGRRRFNVEAGVSPASECGFLPQVSAVSTENDWRQDAAVTGRRDARLSKSPAALRLARAVHTSILFGLLFCQSASAQTATPPIILTVEGTNVFIQRFQSNFWESAYPSQVLRVKDRGRTGADSRTSVRLSDLSVLRIGWHSEFEIQPLPEPGVDAQFSLIKGLLRLLNRDRPGRHRFNTPTATAATRGTEFVLQVEEGTGRTVLTVFEGEAELRNAQGVVELAPGEQGIAEAGRPPRKTAVINTTAIVQWCLYYPGVLDLDELELTPAEVSALSASLAEYRTGDLLRALAAYPAGRTPASDSEKLYLAALLLSVGQVAESEALLGSIAETDPSSRVQQLTGALRLVIGTVSKSSSSSKTPPRSADLQVGAKVTSESRRPGGPRSVATALLAASYHDQSQFRLDEALASTRLAVERSPNFAFGWTRVAELEFSHGRVKPAMAALDRSLALAPRNAQAWALRGFLLAAHNRMPAALDAFERAIALDGGLGNAWLGRGLCHIRRGQPARGRFDLQVAAALEPQRSALRSYLGKAFSSVADLRHAENELKFAAGLDPADPTPWLYSALLLRDQNRINEAVRDLERSQMLNDNRRVYRSRLLLDQDRAVRGANLARVYRDADLTDVSVREAGRAVNADYANYSAHLFLANSFNELRDLKQINLRYETAWFTEYLVANLLAPVGAGTLSSTVSQQEYSRLFERDRFGASSSTEYLSHGEWIQSAAQYGLHGNSSYAAEVFYHTDPGLRPNNDLEQFAAVLQLKHQLTPQDSVYARLSYYDSETGDVNQYFDQAEANPGLRVREHYDPSVLAGYHHEWSPGHHTLLLAGRLVNSLKVENPFQTSVFYDRGSGSTILAAAPVLYDQNYRSDLELYLAELQQLCQRGDHTVVAGGRVQAGTFDTRNVQTDGRLATGPIVDFPITNDFSTPFRRYSVYVYDHWQLCPAFLVAAGVSYDWIQYPENYRYAPTTDDEKEVDRISPKVGVIWTPAQHTTVRAAWFRALGGASLDQSARLEPSQVAGFNQAYRSLIPEAVAGANAAPTFETWAMSLEQKFGRGTFIGLSGELASSEVERTVGAVNFSTLTGLVASGTPEELDFRERTLALTVNQLLGDEWSVGAGYRLSKAELEDRFSEVPAGTFELGGFQSRRSLEATLQQVQLSVLYNHACGFFTRAGAIWTMQDNAGYSPARPGDDFWQFNVEAGYRFARRRAEVRVGLLNLTDEQYRLNPLNLTRELPRQRTLAVSLQVSL